MDNLVTVLAGLLLSVTGAVERVPPDIFVSSVLEEISVESDRDARSAKIDELVGYVCILSEEETREVADASVERVARLLLTHDHADAMAAALFLSHQVCITARALPSLEKARGEYALPPHRVFPFLTRSSSAADEIDTAIRLIAACRSRQ